MAVARRSGEEEREILCAQLGLITTKQAYACGETSASIRAKLRREEWVQVERGIYRCTVFPVKYEQRLLAQCLRSPGHTWASHRSAAWLHGLCGVAPGFVSVTTTGRLRSRAGVSVHHTSWLPPCDVTVIRGVPVTAVEKSLIDLAGKVGEDALNFAIDEAITSKSTSLAKIEWRLRRSGGKGTAGSAALGRCIRSRSRDGQVGSHLEREFFRLLREARLPLPVLQHPIVIGTRTVFADFAYPQQRLIVEVLGYRWHGGQDRWEKDLLRSSDLAAIGWRLIFVTRQQIRKQRLETAERLRVALGMQPLFVL